MTAYDYHMDKQKQIAFRDELEKVTKRHISSAMMLWKRAIERLTNVEAAELSPYLDATTAAGSGVFIQQKSGMRSREGGSK